MITANAGQQTIFIKIFYVYPGSVNINWHTFDLNLVGFYDVTLFGYLPAEPYLPDFSYVHLLSFNNYGCYVSGGTTSAS